MDFTKSTFSSVNPRVIFIHITTCGGFEDGPDCAAGLQSDSQPDFCRLTNQRTDTLQGGGVCVDLQSISERVLSARACLLVERIVCLTAERGWRGRDFIQHMHHKV